MDDSRGQQEYIQQVLQAYRITPGTLGTVRRADRMFGRTTLSARCGRRTTPGKGDSHCCGVGKTEQGNGSLSLP